MFLLTDGTAVRTIGSKGSGKGQFHFTHGGLCVSPDGDSVLVADTYNRRVQEVRIVDGSWVRFVREGVLNKPEFVDCNADIIAVSEDCHRITVLSWADGGVRAQVGGEGSGPGQLKYLKCVRLLSDGSGMVVADCCNNRLCMFSLRGEFVAVVGSGEQGLTNPCDVLERVSDGSLVVTNFGNRVLVQLSRDGVKIGAGRSDPKFSGPIALAALPGDGCFAVDYDNGRVHQIMHRQARFVWIRGCARACP
jgi:hypothetical protein